MTPKLTIGSAVYDDFEGVYFTYQSIRLNNLDVLDDLDLVIIDNNPDSAEGKATKQFCENAHIRYFAEPVPRSTAIRDKIFRNAEGLFTMSIDPHVLFEPNTIKRLLAFLEDIPQCNDIYHGPMLYDYLSSETPATHMEPVWRDNMYGIWGHDKDWGDPEGDPVEIPMHGLGLFLCRTETWAGFSPLFQGFGGEEGYIHGKYKARGDKVILLPFLRWIHRFQRPRGNAYPLNIEERISNYVVGWLELGEYLGDITKHFKKTQKGLDVDAIIDKARELWGEYQTDKVSTLARLHAKDAPHDQEAQIERAEEKGVELWHDTQVNFAEPIEVKIFGKTLRFAKAGATWSLK